MQLKRLTCSTLLTFCFVLGLTTQHTLPRYDLPNMIAGTADRPFVYRQLIPALLSLIPPTYQLTALITLAFACAYATLATLEGNPFILTAWLLFMISHYNHVYDLATLALSAALWWSARRERWLLHGVLFVVMCLNKETAILFVIPLLITKHYKLATVLGLAYAATRALLMWRYQLNEGAVFEWHLWENLTTHAAKTQFTLAVLLLTGWIGLTIKQHWHTVDPYTKATLVALTPIYFVLYLVGGMAFELRVGYELIPALWSSCKESNGDYSTPTAQSL